MGAGSRGRGFDTSTPTGRLRAHLLLAVAEMERERIGERAREAHAGRRRHGLGGSQVPEAVRARILRERAEGRSYPQIAQGLNAEGVPTPHRARWYPGSVRNVVKRAERDQAKAES